MKTVFASLSAVVLASCLAAPTLAMPSLQPGTTETKTPAVEKARLVCNAYRCWHVYGGGYYQPYGYYRPYGYYHPYGYYRPHFGIGPFGVF